jgi:GTP pyrophosphokinase
VEHYRFSSSEEFFVALGYGELSPEAAVKTIRLLISPELRAAPPPPPPRRPGQRPSGIGMAGVDNVAVRFARCCSPIYGDEIFGYIVLGKGVSVHRRDCPNFPGLSLTPERIVKLYWVSQTEDAWYTVILNIEAADRPDLLSEVVGAVSQARLRLTSAKASTRGGRTNLRLSVEIGSREQLEGLMSNMLRIKDVRRVSRLNSRAR